MTLKERKKNSGFTLIESLVAISVLLVAIAGPLSIFSNSLVASRTATDQTTAIYLAQEGIELVRRRRDLGAIRDVDWMNYLGNCTGADGCILHYSGGVEACAGACPILREIPWGLFFYNTSYPESKFTRTVRVTETVNDKEMEVESVVSWVHLGRQREVVIRETLYNYRN